MKKIIKILSSYRKNRALNSFIKNTSNTIGTFSIIFLIITLFEYIFYIEQPIRENIALLYINFLIITFSFLLIKFILHYYSFFNYKNKFEVSKEIGNKHSNIKDQLINILQINKDKNNGSTDLKKYAQESIYKKLSSINLNDFNKINKIEFSKLFLIAIILILILFIPVINSTANRLIQFNKEFPVPLPFNLKSITKNSSALSNDNIKITIEGSGDIPDTILINWIEDEIKYQKSIGKKDKLYTHTLNNVNKNFLYWANYKNPSFFSSWNEISTKKYPITIKQRPKIINVSFTVNPPEYTGLDNFTDGLKNINQIQIPIGSKVIINGQSDKNLNSAWLNTNQDRINLYIENNKFNKNINLKNDIIFTLHCMDNELIPNLNPKQYSIVIKNDNKANISIQKPAKEFEINELMIIPINANIIDDYGLKDIFIEYQIISEDFPQFNQKKEKINLNLSVDGLKKYNLNFNWDINNLPISMGDEVHFQIVAIDNNEIDGNQISKSEIIVGKFPSLESLFTEIEEIETNTQDIMEEINSSIEEISEMTKDMKMELLKSDETNWEQEKKIEDSFKEIEEINSQIEEIEKNIEEIIKKANENQLFDEDLINKFEKFQNLIQEMMSQELYEAMQSLQDALKNMDMNKISEALENYNFNMEQFEKQLDQYMEMFEMALAEQKLNELAEQIENMINKQSDIVDDINNGEDEYVINKKTTKQENRYSEFNEMLNETAKSIDKLSNNISNQLSDLSDSNLNQETQKLIEKQKQSINENISESTKNNLQDIEEIISEINDNFKQELSDKLTKEFIRIIDNLITMSNQQEQIISDANGIQSRSPYLKEINRKQDSIDRQLNQITKQLLDLSNSTFYVNPNINRQIGGLKSSIAKAISNIEQKRVSTAFEQQKEVLKYINNITYLLLLSMEEMQSSNSASGFEKFMESLEEMSSKQQGINQMTMQLGQMGMMQQKSILEELLKQQSELKQQLEDLIGDNPGEETGGLSNAGDEMDEVILDLKNNNINRKTIERQQRILSKMLDSQKSLTQKDFSKKRISKSAGNYNSDYINTNLNIIEKNSFFIDAMESALNEDIPLDYKNVTRLYFLNLQKETNDNE